MNALFKKRVCIFFLCTQSHLTYIYDVHTLHLFELRMLTYST